MSIDLSFLPSLQQSDIERTVDLINQGYGPQAAHKSPTDLKNIQSELFAIQKLPEAWGLVVPLLNHPDQSVQFFGAHTAQVKIARDWEVFPLEHASALRDVLVQLTVHSVCVAHRSNIVIRKLFVTLTSLALKIVPHSPGLWPNWILSVVTALSDGRASSEHILEFLSIVAEEVDSASLLGPSHMKMKEGLKESCSMVMQAIKNSLGGDEDVVSSALRCFQVWLTHIPIKEIQELIPLLITLLNPTRDVMFGSAVDALSEVMLVTKSSPQLVTEPILIWLDTIQIPPQDEDVSQALCKLVTALGDYSTEYFSSHVASSTIMPSTTQPKSYYTQLFLRTMLTYTGYPGYYGVDEDVSEMVLGFWYLWQEALWSGDDADEGSDAQEKMNISKAVYVELVKILKVKVTFPKNLSWTRDQIEKFYVYRRDVGDTLINAHYVVRDDMVMYYINDIRQELQKANPQWEEVEASMHCFMSIQEALDYDNTPQIGQLFSAEILNRIPSTFAPQTPFNISRLRRTILGLISTYSGWFVAQPPSPEIIDSLLRVLNYVVTSLSDEYLSLQAAAALRTLCDDNRRAFSTQITAFGELYANLGRIPTSDQAKVMQSIASVIEALPPDDQVQPLDAMVSPIVARLSDSLANPRYDVRDTVVLQLETLSGVAKGLTKGSLSVEPLLSIEENGVAQAEVETIRRVREDARMVNLRQGIISCLGRSVEIFGIDTEVSTALLDLCKSITALPSEMSLISLPAAPLLELVCFCIQRQVTASWLSLAAALAVQLCPAPPMPFSEVSPEEKVREEEERLLLEEQGKIVMHSVLPVLLNATLTLFNQPGAMEMNPDVVQEFFNCLDRIAQEFIGNFYTLPEGALDAVLACAERALSLQERYSVVASCAFLTTLIHRTRFRPELKAHWPRLVASHGRSIMRAVLCGFAGAVPRSVIPNIEEMLYTLLFRCVEESGGWIRDVLYADDFIESKATPEAKEKLIRGLRGTKNRKKIRDAVTQFTIVARGLEGSTFGYAAS